MLQCTTQNDALAQRFANEGYTVLLYSFGEYSWYAVFA